jgi:hypothetical protein
MLSLIQWKVTHLDSLIYLPTSQKLKMMKATFTKAVDDLKRQSLTQQQKQGEMTQLIKLLVQAKPHTLPPSMLDDVHVASSFDGAASHCS